MQLLTKRQKRIQREIMKQLIVYTTMQLNTSYAQLNVKNNNYYYLIILLDEKGEKLKEQLRKKVDEYLNRAEELKKAMAEQKNHKAVPSGAGKDGDSKDSEDAETKKMQNALSSAILSEKPNVRWDDIAGLESAKEALKEAVILPIKFPHLFSGKRTPWKGILLYGVNRFLTF